MARKKGRDLFEVLGARASGTRPAPKKESVAPVGFGDIGDWFKGLIPQRSKGQSPDRKASSASSSTPNWGGLALAAVVFAVFGLGFLIGRGTSGAGGVEAKELRAGANAPGWIEESWLSPEQEEERLSQYGLRLLYYPALERDRASDLARWLRERGLHRTRLRRMQTRDSKETVFAVVCYTEDASGAAELDLIESLDASWLDPRWKQMRVRRLGS